MNLRSKLGIYLCVQMAHFMNDPLRYLSTYINRHLELPRQARHTYPRLYLEKKKCAWEMILLTLFKCYVDNLNPKFKKSLASRFWKNGIWSFLPYKA